MRNGQHHSTATSPAGSPAAAGRGWPAAVNIRLADHKLDFQAQESWLLLAERDRRLDGQAAVSRRSLSLVAGSTEKAKLIVDGQPVARIVIWSPKILAGLEADLADARRTVADALTGQGLLQSKRTKAADRAVSVVAAPTQARPEGLSLLFAERRDLPVAIESRWSDVAFGSSTQPGRLGVIYDDKEQIIYDRGNLTYVVLSEKRLAVHKAKSRLIILTPDFDFQNIDNIVLLKSLIKEHQP